MGMHKKIAVLTTSRADFGHLYWPLRHLAEHPDLEVRIIAMGPHLSPEFGTTIDELIGDDFHVEDTIECLLSSDTDIGMAKSIGVATLGLADVLGRMRPDILLLIADRYEMLAPASTALALRIPIAHIEGGDVSEGAIDDAVRNMLTKAAHLHFTPTEPARRRVLAMGEEYWRVHAVGAPSLDHLTKRELLDRDALEAEIGVRLDTPPCIVSCHPVTLLDDTLAEADALFGALARLERQIIFCFPNADAGSRALIARAEGFCRDHPRARLFVNLNPLVYWSVLRHAACLVGNSSSGIMETPSLRLPTVNVGIRQRGRLRAANVIDVPASEEAIIAGLRQAVSSDFRHTLEDLVNPYGDGHAGERIAEALARAPERSTLLEKRALPLAESEDLYAFRHEH